MRKSLIRLEQMKTHTLERPNKSTPKIYSTEDTPSEEKIVYEHYFLVGTNVDYFVLEYDEETDEIFCFAELIKGCGELGYSSLKEMENITISIPVQIEEITLYMEVKIEKDAHWIPIPLGKALELRNQRSTD